MTILSRAWPVTLYFRAWRVAAAESATVYADFVPYHPIRGWYMLEIMAAQHLSDLDVLIEVGSDVHRHPIDIGQNLTGKRIVHCPEPIRRLRFERNSGVSVGRISCRVKRLTRAFATSRMHQKITSAIATGRISPVDHERLEDDDLSKLYEQCFRRRLGLSADGYREWRSSAGSSRPARIAAMADVSIIVPCYRSRPHELAAMLASIHAQATLPCEVILVDDGSPEPVSADLSGTCPVHLLRLDQNRGIAAATRAGLEHARGRFVAFVDHDDVLPPDTMAWVADAIERRPNTELLYSDEDKIDDFGRNEPHFKPDFNYDLLLAQNYIGHLLVVRRELALSVGALGPGIDGSQDHDLILRCIERLKPEQIIHIPQVCYHWRRSATSTAAHASSKPYTAEAGLRAVGDHLRRRGVAAEVEHGRYPNTYRVRWPLADPPPVTLIVPTRDGGQVLTRCLEGLLVRTAYPRLQLIIVDNQSRSEETLSLLRGVERDRRVRVLRYDHPFNFSAINNSAVDSAAGEVIGLINDDIEVRQADWLQEMVSNAVRKDVGCVGAKLLYPDGTVQHAGVVLGIGGVAGHGHKHLSNDRPGYFSRLHLAHEVSAVTGACLVVRKEIYQKVGGLDAEHLAVAFNDIDFCLRVRAAGYRNVWTPWAELIHHESKTRGPEDTPEKKARFHREMLYMKDRWGPLLERDPAYSPHLSLRREDFSLRTLD